MSARAQSTAQTAERVLDAALAGYAALPYDLIRLEDVAEHAGVTVQTVLRRFDGKPGLIIAMVEREFGRIVEARVARSGVSRAELVHELVQHYERYGDLILKMYAEADRVEGLADLASRARGYHVQWCVSAFGELLDTASPDAVVRARRTAQLVAVLDAATWRILRRDAILPPQQVEIALTELLEAVTLSHRTNATNRQNP